MRVRRKTLVLFLLPGILLLWMIGWSLYWIGDNHTTDKQNHKKQPVKIQAALNLQEHEIPQ